MTVAAASAIDTPDRFAPSPTRMVGLLAIATAIAAMVLLGLHPGGAARTFAEVVKEEADNQFMNAVVHGGYIAVLALQTVCYAIFLVRLGNTRAAAVAGLVFFAMGVAFMCPSLVVDGLVTPAVAARYLAKPDKIESARVLFVLMGTLVTFLMPIGLMLQSAGIAAWGWALTASGARIAGPIGLALGGLSVLALGAGFVLANPMATMAALAATAAWALVVGIYLFRKAA